MDMIASPALFGAGVLSVLVGLWVYLRSGRSVVDAAQDAAWDVVKSRDVGAVRKHADAALSEIGGDGSVGGGVKSISWAVC